MVDYQTLFQFLQTIGILVGVSYYIVSLRNQSRTRQIQLIVQLAHQRTEDTSKRNLELLGMEWGGYDEFERKYGSDVNPDNFAMRSHSWYQYNTIGLLLKKRLIDADTLFSLQSGETALFHWNKFRSIIMEIRRRYNMPRFCIYFEYLADENMKYLKQNGFTVEVPDTYYAYIPDE
jgi:hypothetical protein